MDEAIGFAITMQAFAELRGRNNYDRSFRWPTISAEQMREILNLVGVEWAPQIQRAGSGSPTSNAPTPAQSTTLGGAL